MDVARERLASAMDEQRMELRLRWQQVAVRAEISTTHLQRIRSGNQALTPEVKVRLEDALGWRRGNIDRILAGSGPTTGDTEPALYDNRPFSEMSDEELGRYMREHYPEVGEALIERDRRAR